MSNWQEIYKSKLRTFDEAVSLIKDNDRVWMSPASATPIQLIEALQKRALAKEINGVHLVSGQMLVPFEFLKSAEHRPHLTYDTVFFGILERKLAKFGNININSCQFSQLGLLVSTEVVPPGATLRYLYTLYTIRLIWARVRLSEPFHSCSTR